MATISDNNKRKALLEKRIMRLEKLLSRDLKSSRRKFESTDLMSAVDNWFNRQNFGDDVCFALSEYEAEDFVMDCCDYLVRRGFDEDFVDDMYTEISERLATLGEANCSYDDLNECDSRSSHFENATRRSLVNRYRNK